ncbi:MAG: peroxiredoxin [Marinovum algicola]|jgi:peroxiredoxin|uniref:Glutathione-dependent peroxiredoxin n=1 Tax=Marinovum algicola TaxID=42444 RepID=A0A975W8R7_9RHOB|nr:MULTISPECIES: peroxiredoxin [Marinovum]AKO98236.1 Peroxiredoxin [Marinovum algicola DG 898]MDD9742235.1 peroxiredoxin [Marinovum sp. SP66]MDD9744535.1 peroxiredoxin [Marinovum sp. PR37]SEJ19424.1 thiol peroxidase (atypical 2-Cys peroxiredoxin) [Marinovum algicola]SLN75449.1 Putative peroxiredoxin [Marinovum algicola]
MTISSGDTLPTATLLRIGADGPETVDLGARLKGRKTVIFGLPGAFTRTCSSAHVPSFIRTRAAFEAKGVQDIICVSVNDPFVMHAWGESSGANAAGLSFLADSGAEFTKAIGMNFTAPAVGFFDRSVRYALYAEDGVVQVLHREESPGVCEASAGEALLAAI